VTRRALGLGAVALLLVVALWYAALYQPERSHVKALQAGEQVAASAVLGLDARYAGLVKSKAELPAERAALAALRRAVPNGPELDNLVTALYSAASNAGVELSSISSPEPADFGASQSSPARGPAQVMLTLSVTGTPAHVQKLVKVLTLEPRLFVVDSFGLTYTAAPAQTPSSGHGRTKATSATPAAGAVGTSISLRAFYALPNADSAAS